MRLNVKNILIILLIFFAFNCFADNQIPSLIKRNVIQQKNMHSLNKWELWKDTVTIKADPGTSRVFWFNPTRGAKYKAIRKKIHISRGSYNSSQFVVNETYSGKLRKLGARKPLGFFFLSKSQKGETSGTSGYFVTGDGRTFDLHGEGNTIWLKETDESKQPGCPVSINGKYAVSSTKDHNHNTQIIDPPVQSLATADIKLLVVYTTSAKTAIGGTSAMLSQINVMIANANTVYSNSNVNATLSLVEARELDTDETGYSFGDILDHITFSDGVWDNVSTLRAEYEADLVAVIVNNSSYCGLGWLMTTNSTSFARYGYSVVNNSCVTALVHEIGHNSGLHHDIDNTSNEGVFPYSYGWRWIGNSSQQWRSAMAYSPGTRVPFFSNPDIRYDGVATGLSGVADNAASMNVTDNTVAAFSNSLEPTPTSTVIPPTNTSTPTPTPIVPGPTLTPTPQATSTSTPINNNNPGLPLETATPGPSGDPVIKSIAIQCTAKDKTGTFKITLIDKNTGALLSGHVITVTRGSTGLKSQKTGEDGSMSFKFKNNQSSRITTTIFTTGEQRSKKCVSYKRRK